MKPVRRSVLIIEESALFRDYLASKLEELGLVVIKATNGVDGAGKLAHHLPDLVITDYYLTQRDLLTILKNKQSDVTTSSIPVIVIANRISRDKLLELTKLNVRKFFTKPLKIDLLWSALVELLGIEVKVDPTPCVIDAHMNEDIAFIEIAMGLNLDKINLLEFRITELLEIHRVELPKFLVLMTNLDVREADQTKLRRLLEILVSFTKGRVKWIKILTQSKTLEKAIRSFWEYSEITVTDTLDKAMDDLLDKAKVDGLIQDSLPRRVFEGTGTENTTSLELRFDKDNAFASLSNRLSTEGSDLTIAVVDDDFIVQEIIKNTFSNVGCKVLTYDDGRSFLAKLPEDLDLIFLDLMMPNMNGFEVMEKLRSLGHEVPIIILSALSRRETVLRAMSYGIRSYMTKPIKPDEVLKKTIESVGAQF
jgi:CheY-like chemotaxis protein